MTFQRTIDSEARHPRPGTGITGHDGTPIPPQPMTVGEAIIVAITGGNTRQAAAGWAGTWPETITRWETRGLKELTRMTTNNTDTPTKTETPYVNLALDLHFAAADAEVRMTAEWQQHFPRDWRAVERYMRRRFPETWGEGPKRLEFSGPAGAPITVSGAPMGVLDIGGAQAVLERAEARIAAEDAEGAVIDVQEAAPGAPAALEPAPAGAAS